jgi:tricorn protease-like protein
MHHHCESDSEYSGLPIKRKIAIFVPDFTADRSIYDIEDQRWSDASDSKRPGISERFAASRVLWALYLTCGAHIYRIVGLPDYQAAEIYFEQGQSGEARRVGV